MLWGWQGGQGGGVQWCTKVGSWEGVGVRLCIAPKLHVLARGLFLYVRDPVSLG